MKPVARLVTMYGPSTLYIEELTSNETEEEKTRKGE